jgi:isopentenyl-diphosphate delta-isomerase
MSEKVILVDKFDNYIGTMDKMEAHQKGLLHRAISVFIFNSYGDMLIQRRALKKYHSPGIWSNTACTHPRLNEEPIIAAKRRLKEEMGITADINFCFKFTYKANLEHALIEHEIDHVFIGVSDNIPEYNTEEVCEYKYISQEELKLELEKNPTSFSEWFKLCYKQAYMSLNKTENKKINDH